MSLNVIDLVVRPSSHCYPVRACTAGVKQCLRACVCVCVYVCVLYAVTSATSYYQFRGSTPFKITHGSLQSAMQLIFQYAKIQAESIWQRTKRRVG